MKRRRDGAPPFFCSRNPLHGAVTVGRETYEALKPKIHLPKGHAREAIPALAGKVKVNLVVMGTVARTGILGLIIGNTAECIFGQIDCSVLAFKPDGFVTPVTIEK